MSVDSDVVQRSRKDNSGQRMEFTFRSNRVHPGVLVEFTFMSNRVHPGVLVGFIFRSNRVHPGVLVEFTFRSNRVHLDVLVEFTFRSNRVHPVLSGIYPQEQSSSLRCFSGVCVAQSNQASVKYFVNNCLSLCSFLFDYCIVLDHCIVYPSIYDLFSIFYFFLNTLH